MEKTQGHITVKYIQYCSILAKNIPRGVMVYMYLGPLLHCTTDSNASLSGKFDQVHIQQIYNVLHFLSIYQLPCKQIKLFLSCTFIYLHE